MQIFQPVPKQLYVYVISCKLHIATVLALIRTVVCEAGMQRTLFVLRRYASSRNKFLGTDYTLPANPTFNSKEPYCKTEQEHVRCHSRPCQIRQRLELHGLFRAM